MYNYPLNVYSSMNTLHRIAVIDAVLRHYTHRHTKLPQVSGNTEEAAFFLAGLHGNLAAFQTLTHWAFSFLIQRVFFLYMTALSVIQVS